LILLYIAYLFYLPFKAERHFRDGYNQSVIKKYSKAKYELEKAKELAPWETHYQVKLGHVYVAYAKQQPSLRLKVHYYYLAERLYHDMIQLDPNNPWFRNRLSMVYLTRADLEKDKEEAKKYKRLALHNAKVSSEIDRQNPLFQLNYASFLHREGILKEAKKHYQLVIQYDPRIAEAHYNLADIYRIEGNLDQVLSQYLELYKHKPDFPNIELAISSAYLQLNQSDKAIPFLEKATSENPKAEALRSLAILYHQKSQWDNAIKTYETYFQHHGFNQELHPYYIQVLLNAHQLVKARKYLEQFLQQFPNDQKSRKQLQLIQETLNSQ